jgi:hypothetical protein
VAAWLSLIIGVYAVVAVASILGLLTGGFAGILGGLVSLAVLTDVPRREPVESRRPHLHSTRLRSRCAPRF